MPAKIHPLLKPKREKQRRLLALDGGGIRGLITLGVLEKLEADLGNALKAGKDFRLAHYFDFIGGTSTGAILAAGLSIEMKVSELISFYMSAGPMMFEKELLYKRLWNTYRSDPLKQMLQDVLGARTLLGSDKLKSLLLLVMRNATTDSPWPITNNPNAKYNDRSRADCNLNLPLWQLVRASTAAPVYFPPEVIVVGQQQFVFVDGGVTPYNLPAFLMYRMATARPYGLSWKIGEDKMMIVSIGTGSVPSLGPDASDPSRSLLGTATSIAGELMNGMAYDQDINCRTIGRCVFGPHLDREVGDLVISKVKDKGPERHFSYARYNPELTRKGLDELGFKNVSPERVAKLDAVDASKDLLAIGRAYGEKWVRVKDHFPAFLS